MTADSELLARVEAATGPDRQIDIALALLFSIGPTEGETELPRWSASVDAVMALIERVLPGARWYVGHDARSEIFATIWWDGVNETEAYGATPALAILAALLKSRNPSRTEDVK